MDGILLIDKPAAITSYGVVDRLKKRFNLTKIGHGGTLDPMATGLLVILIGRGTRQAGRILKGDKEYLASILLGRVTDSQDITGRVLNRAEKVGVSREELEAVLEKFRGVVKQIPPMVSALKYRGQPLYKLARRGIVVTRSPRKVEIKELVLLEFNSPELRLRIRCSKGTYIRTLSHDLGKSLGCGACLSALRRTRSGSFRVGDAYSLDSILSATKAGLKKRLLSLLPLTDCSEISKKPQIKRLPATRLPAGRQGRQVRPSCSPEKLRLGLGQNAALTDIHVAQLSSCFGISITMKK